MPWRDTSSPAQAVPFPLGSFLAGMWFLAHHTPLHPPPHHHCTLDELALPVFPSPNFREPRAGPPGTEH